MKEIRETLQELLEEAELRLKEQTACNDYEGAKRESEHIISILYLLKDTLQNNQQPIK